MSKLLRPLSANNGVASESAFREAYAAWHMDGGGPPVTTKWVTVTRSDVIKFEIAAR